MFFRVLVIGGISVLLALGGATFVAWRAAQSVPAFYQHASRHNGSSVGADHLVECADCGGCDPQLVLDHGQEMDEGATEYVPEEKLTFLDLP